MCIYLQVGFAIATCAELALPTSGIFGTWGGNEANAYIGAAILLIATAAVRLVELLDCFVQNLLHRGMERL